MDGTILIADDDRTIRTVLSQALTRAGCKVHATASMATLRRWVGEGKGDLVISDVFMPDGNGLDALPEISSQRPDLPVIIISAQNTIVTAIQAAEAEAFDYLPKPFDLMELMKRVGQALDSRQVVPQEPTPAPSSEELPLVGRTEAMQVLYRVLARVMNTDLSVLITGESGTGKSLVARAVHDFSDRKNAPYISITAEDLEGDEDLRRFATRAADGTLVIEELGDLDATAQARLVQFVEAVGPGGPRFVATSQVDLRELLSSGQFRQDLFYRLNGVTLSVPPLRERGDDIPLLVDHFTARAERGGVPAKGFTEDALALMRAYRWPGNLRQLDLAVRRMMVTAAEARVSRADVEAMLRDQPDLAPAGDDSESLSQSVARHLQRYFKLHGDSLPPPGVYGRILREIEVPLIEIALDATGGNQAKCADLLGINRNTLRKKMTDLDILVTRRRKLM